MKIGKSYRQPDLQIILKDNPHYTKTGRQGPADICIEIVSLESVQRDYEVKYKSYEMGDVREYWIIDPREESNQAKFYRLEDGKYTAVEPDADSNHTTPIFDDVCLEHDHFQ